MEAHHYPERRRRAGGAKQALRMPQYGDAHNPALAKRKAARRHAGTEGEGARRR